MSRRAHGASLTETLMPAAEAAAATSAGVAASAVNVTMPERRWPPSCTVTPSTARRARRSCSPSPSTRAAMASRPSARAWSMATPRPRWAAMGTSNSAKRPGPGEQR